MRTSGGSRRRAAFTTLLAIAVTTTAVMAVSAPSFAKDGRPRGATAPNKPKKTARPPKLDRGRTDVDKGGVAPADQTIADDLIVQGSGCFGLDCVTNENFGFDTLILKENNLRILFSDTSATAGFATNDWRIVANDSASGGLNYLAFEDATAATLPFRVEAGAGADALYVKSGGNVGLGTSSPVLDLDIASGNTPALRLGQNASGGFTAQTWDVAGNEANFFIRDVTGGSRLPFRIRPGAPTSSVDIAASGNVGIGTASPAANLHVSKTGGADRTVIKMSRNGNVGLLMEDTTLTNPVNAALPLQWSIGTSNATGNFTVSLVGRGNLLELTQAGVLKIGGTTVNVPDYVFEDGYRLLTLDELAAYIEANGHLPGVASAADVAAAGGVDIVGSQMQLLEKIEELTLYTLQQEDAIGDLRVVVEEQQGVIDALTQRLEALEAAR